MGQDTVSRAAEPSKLSEPAGREIQAAWRRSVGPLLGRLSRQRDLRLVRTLRDGAETVIGLRVRPQALWLTELGSLLLGTAHVPARGGGVVSGGGRAVALGTGGRPLGSATGW